MFGFVLAIFFGSFSFVADEPAVVVAAMIVLHFETVGFLRLMM